MTSLSGPTFISFLRVLMCVAGLYGRHCLCQAGQAKEQVGTDIKILHLSFVQDKHSDVLKEGGHMPEERLPVPPV